jgi:ribonuclease P protein component
VLPHQARLRSRVEFAEVSRRGDRAGTPALVLHLQPGDPESPTRAGFIVSRAVGTAVTRNLVRRRLRHLVAERLNRLPAGSRLIVRATPAAGTATSAALAAQLDRSLERLTTVVAPR